MRAVLLLAALLAGGLLSACGEGSPSGPRTTARPPADFVGLVSEDLLAATPSYRHRTLERQRAAGVRLIRQTFHWNQIEIGPGRFDFGFYDGYVADLARERMRLLPILFDPPAFRSSAPGNGAARGTYPPRDPGAMGRFAAALAGRYGPSGSFWRSHPDLPDVPIRSWQVWNEPNLRVYWASGPDPAAYTRLLRVVGRAIKGVDPRAEIVSAGLPQSQLGVPFRKFVEGMEKAQAKSAYDVFALHPFAIDAEDATSAVEEARKLLASHGDRAPIWVTEVGWASGGPSSPFTVGERGQALRVRELLRDMAARRRELGIRGVVYYDWKDARPYPGGENFFGLHTGLLALNGRPKPALGAFTREARRIRCQGSIRKCVHSPAGAAPPTRTTS